MTVLRTNILMLLFAGAVLFAALAAALVFGGVLSVTQPDEFSSDDFAQPDLGHRFVTFSDLPGWRSDDPTAALFAFIRSCEAFDEKADDAPANPLENHRLLKSGVSFGGKVGDWRETCAEARRVSAQAHANEAAKRSAFRAFFEYYFQPVQIFSRREPLPDGRASHAGPLVEDTGLFTGYFEPVYEAASSRTDKFTAPVLTRPGDLVEVNLGDFRDELKGERIAGRVESGRLVPYADRKDIDAGAVSEKAAPLAWLDPNDLFFLQIQGSGQLKFPNGNIARIGYDAQNGHAYTAIGRVMVQRGLMPLEEVTMASIRDWLDTAPPEDAQALREENASYVFFRELEDADPALGPLGAQGVPLTPERSLAADRRFHALGALAWIELEGDEDAGLAPMRRLMVIQDTGGAIRGPVRGDVFWGAGDKAGEIAGAMNARGRMIILLPNPVARRLPKSSVK